MRDSIPLPQILAVTLLGLAAPARADRVPAPRQGTLDKEVIRRVIREHINDVRRCYEAGLAKKPGLEGRVIVRFTVAASGSVSGAKMQESTMNDPPTEECITAAVKTWKFPRPEGDGPVVVSYPFVLKSDGPPPAEPGKPGK